MTPGAASAGLAARPVVRMGYTGPAWKRRGPWHAPA